MTDSLTRTIADLEDRRWAAQIAADTDTLAGLLADELVYTHSNGVVDTKASYLGAIADAGFDYRSEERSDVVTTCFTDTVIVTGRVRFQVVVGGRGEPRDLDSRYTAVWVRSGDTWRFACWQSTPLPV